MYLYAFFALSSFRFVWEMTDRTLKHLLQHLRITLQFRQKKIHFSTFLTFDYIHTTFYRFCSRPFFSKSKGPLTNVTAVTPVEYFKGTDETGKLPILTSRKRRELFGNFQVLHFFPAAWFLMHEEGSSMSCVQNHLLLWKFFPPSFLVHLTYSFGAMLLA